MAELELLSDLHQEVWPLDFIIEAGSDDGDVVAPSLAGEGGGVVAAVSGEKRLRSMGLARIAGAP